MVATKAIVGSDKKCKQYVYPPDIAAESGLCIKIVGVGDRYVGMCFVCMYSYRRGFLFVARLDKCGNIQDDTGEYTIATSATQKMCL